jgi:ribosomal protein S18 acetylase RimI-like enzyme
VNTVIDGPGIDGVAIRRATPADAQALSRVSELAFTGTFGHLYSDVDLQTFLRDSYAVEAYARFLADPAHACWLVERDGEAVGYALAGPCGLPHPDVTADDGELKRIYLLPQVQGGGHGDRLFQAAIDWLGRRGPRTLWIGVWSENHRALRFYRRHGFEKAGEYEFIVGGSRDHEFILRRNPPRA